MIILKVLEGDGSRRLDDYAVPYPTVIVDRA